MPDVSSCIRVVVRMCENRTEMEIHSSESWRDFHLACALMSQMKVVGHEYKCTSNVLLIVRQVLHTYLHVQFHQRDFLYLHLENAKKVPSPNFREKYHFLLY